MEGDGPMSLQAALHVEGAGSPPVIRALGLVKSFGALRAVDNITFDLAPGRIYGLLGPNGSGKTTLIRLLAGLTPPTAGWAEVLGTRMPSRPNLSRIGYMTQADGVYSALTVAENARFFGAMYGVVGAEPAAAALGLVDHADRRASIVDPLLRVQFWSHFRALADAGTTIVVSSHVMDEADRCDELLFVRSGKIIARGTGLEIRAQAGTADLEQAFLRLGGDVDVTR
jgi:ABC-2 type transport system ATP-binding protein